MCDTDAASTLRRIRQYLVPETLNVVPVFENLGISLCLFLPLLCDCGNRILVLLYNPTSCRPFQYSVEPGREVRPQGEIHVLRINTFRGEVVRQPHEIGVGTLIPNEKLGSSLGQVCVDDGSDTRSLLGVALDC
jgi:hypothetical protein